VFTFSNLKIAGRGGQQRRLPRVANTLTAPLIFTVTNAASDSALVTDYARIIFAAVELNCVQCKNIRNDRNNEPLERLIRGLRIQ